MSSQLFPIVDFRAFSGLDKVSDPTRAKTPTSDSPISVLVEAMDVDIDDTLRLKRRAGQALKYSGSNLHSGFELEGSSYLMSGSTLLKLSSDMNSATTIAILSTDNELSHDIENGRAYLTNGVDIGYLFNDSFYPFPEVHKHFKEKMPAGQILTCFHNRLYVARGNELYMSDPAAHGFYDVRYGKQPFPGVITLLAPVKDGDGIFIAFGSIHFMVGKQRPFNVVKKAGYDAIPGIVARPRSDISIGGVEISSPVLFGSQRGLCVGGTGGVFENITEKTYPMQQSLKGSGTIRNTYGMTQFIAVIQQ